MSFLFGGSSTPQISQVPPPAITTNADQDKIKEDEKAKLRQGRKTRSTLLTGPRGLLEPAPVSQKTLLGQ